jgi:membrane associated rhomboid family serine protease
MGALEVDKVVHGHQVWRLLSCIWLHGGVIHVLANMLSLVFIGIRLEQEFGFGMALVIILALFKYIIIFLVTNKMFKYMFIHHCLLHKCSRKNSAEFIEQFHFADYRL